MPVQAPDGEGVLRLPSDDVQGAWKTRRGWALVRTWEAPPITSDPSCPGIQAVTGFREISRPGSGFHALAVRAPQGPTETDDRADPRNHWLLMGSSSYICRVNFPGAHSLK